MTKIKVVEIMKDYLLATLNLILNLTLRVIWRSTLNFLMKILFFSDLKKAGNFTFRYVVMSVIKVTGPLGTIWRSSYSDSHRM